MNKHSFLTEINHSLSAITRLAVLAALCLAQIVWAQTENNVSYIDENGVMQKADGVTVINSTNIATINDLDGWYLVRGNLTRNTTLMVSGTAHIILGDGSDLKVTGNITVAGSCAGIDFIVSSTTDNSLAIYAQSAGSNMGKLTATGNCYGSCYAGISNVSVTGTITKITINGGTITAIGGSGGFSGAGIGGSGQGNDGGIITINGGIVTAKGGSDRMGGGAGIGGSGYGGLGGTIKINGGTITAIGGVADNGSQYGGGAGIGGGGTILGGGNGGTITISGGIVTAIGGNGSDDVYGGGGAGIGGGGGGGNGGTITISGGMVMATGGNISSSYFGYGIGSGYSGMAGTLAMSSNSIVFASSVSDNSNKTGGVLVIGNTTNWYGSNNITLSPIRYTVPIDYTLTIPSSRTLTIPNAATLINNGTVIPADNSTIVINGTRTGNLIQGANVSTPKLASKTTTSITINASSLLAKTGQAIEYAKNTTNTVPASGWQTETTFTELNEGTTYYIFARSQANTNFAAGTSTNVQIKTIGIPEAANLRFTIPAGHIYNGNSQGIGTVSPRSGVVGMGTITVLYNGSTTAPTNVGTYEVTVNIAKGDEFVAVDGIVLGEYAIALKPITVTAAGKTKVYGTSDPALTYSVAPTLASGDKFNGSLIRAEGENAGNYAISQGTLSVSGNYELTFAGANFTITPKPIAIAAEAKTKVYGSPDPELTYSIAPELINDDTFSGELSRAEGENAGDYAISQGSLTAGSNYELTFASANFAITPKPITVAGLSANGKTYDGTATAAVAGTAVISGAIDGDDVTVVCTASFADKNAETDKPVVFNCSPGGADGGNYTLSEQPASVTADIAAKPIAVTAAAGQSKVYGTLDIEFTYSVEPALVSGDDFGGELDRAEGESVGDYSINQGTLTAGNNYNITFESANFAITAQSVTITGVSAANKEYDGTTVATVTGTATVSGKVGSDDVTVINGTASFADNKAGTGKPVTFSGFSLGGTAAGNYELTAQPVSVAANITAKPVTITGITVANKEYDGTATATVTGTATISGAIEDDNVTIINGTASFADKNVGTNKLVTFNGFSLGGTDADNYVLTAQPASVTADITSQSSPILPLQTANNHLLTPTKNGITLTAKTNATVAVYNLSGRLISRQNYNAGNHSISFGHLPKGMYIVKASHGSEKEILRVPVR
jgi:hypothetical protein